MAVTSIWAIKSRVDNVIRYVRNPEKTIERPEESSEAMTARKAVGDVLEYAQNADKTEKMMYVTGIGCNPATAADDFMVVKKRWHKEGGRLAYHGYQSFKEGDGQITAKQAHDIGVELAQRLWGDRYQVVIATHLNTGHYHNHFVINSVSYADGKKFVRTNDDYKRMREISDKLCREAGLHIVDNPSIARGKTYDEWLAERAGRPTVRGRIREDIDYAIRMSYGRKSFANIMHDMGYEFKFYNEDRTRELVHPGIKPPGAKGFFRFDSLGEGYDFDSIERRVIENMTTPGVPLISEAKSYEKWSPPEYEVPGLPKLYRRYCVRLYAYISNPKKREFIPMALREDIVKLDHYIEQLDFLYNNSIQDNVSLQNKLNAFHMQLNDLILQRKRLYAHKKWAVENHKAYLVDKDKSEIQDASRHIRELRKKIKLCNEVFVSSERIKDLVNAPDRKPEVPVVKTKNKSRLR